ncbi:exported hypothetical protein [Tenacibaculum sp. 190524A02b]|uniref:Uncharacterized protein n=1 Tax=Tenacibaculum vairaonense TaxID=3137860 RepID=A0ABP1FBM4_9FLAO
MKKYCLFTLAVCLFSKSLFSQEYINLTTSNINKSKDISHIGSLTLGTLYNDINDPWRGAAGRLLELYKPSSNVSLRVGNQFGKFSLSIAGSDGAFFPSAKKGNVILRKHTTDRVIFSLNSSANNGTNSFVFGDAVNQKTLSIFDNGRVGIGVDKPLDALHINGSIRGNIGPGALRVKSGAGYLDIGAQNTSWAHIYTDRPKIIFNKDVYTITNAFSSYNNDLILKTSGTERFRIKKSNGFVGIGTNNPDTELTVKGKIHTQEVKVDLNGVLAPDYVFLKDYNLKTLDEVSEHIKQKGHLPNVPSAKEMEKEGVNLKIMTLKLLEKIEELTLYTLEQDKKIKEQEKRLIALEKK